MSIKTQYNKIPSYTTKDGSQIRELMHPGIHGNSRQSLAEAIIPFGSVTFLHRHLQAEEIYYITEGAGMMTLGDEHFEVSEGDSVCILPGIKHRIKNIGETALKILCCCSPPYLHDDTELME